MINNQSRHFSLDKNNQQLFQQYDKAHTKKAHHNSDMMMIQDEQSTKISDNRVMRDSQLTYGNSSNAQHYNQINLISTNP